MQQSFRCGGQAQSQESESCRVDLPGCSPPSTLNLDLQVVLTSNQKQGATVCLYIIKGSFSALPSTRLFLFGLNSQRSHKDTRMPHHLFPLEYCRP